MGAGGFLTIPTNSSVPAAVLADHFPPARIFLWTALAFRGPTCASTSSGCGRSAFHKERGLSLRLSLAWELELPEGCLRAAPDFVARHPQGDPAREEMTVPVASGPLRLVLSWVAEDEA